MLTYLTEEQCKKIDGLLKTDEAGISLLQTIKQPPTQPSPKAMMALTNKLYHFRLLNGQICEIA
jgi:hypothetical protein